MNETSFNKVFYDGYLVTYAPAQITAYSSIYPDIYADSTIIEMLMHLHMYLHLRTNSKAECGRRDLNPSYKLGKLM
jgi:hypothetical protein